MINRFLLGLLLVQTASAQPTANILTRISMVESAFVRGTVFSLDVDKREYWITAKHVLTGAEHPPYGTIKSKSERLRILQGEQWLTVEFSVLDPGEDIDIVVLAPPHLLLSNPLASLPPSQNGVMMGGNCQFLGYPYGEGWPVKFNEGTLTWLPYVKNCGVSALPQGEKRYWTLDGINNVGFSGGPVTYLTGPQQQVFAVVSGYLTEPADVITSPLPGPPAPPKPPAPPQPPAQRKSSQAKSAKEQGKTKQLVNVNSGFIIAFDIQYAIDAIHKSPIGPLRNPH
jgi:hypothetical protein